MRFVIEGDLVRGTATGDIAGPLVSEQLAGKDVRLLRFDNGEVFDASSVTRWYIDDRGERHLVAGPGRQKLDCLLSDEIERDGAGGWSVVDRLTRLKERRKAAIDAEAERQRLRWITPGAGQAMTYQAKVDEVRALAIDGEDPDPSHYPMLSAEVGITAATLQDVAGVVMAAYQQWQMIGATIEAIRLGAKRAVELAETVEDVAAIEIAWPNPA
jgi:hypothetical protein